jgi:hypothetical protein
MSCGLLVVFVGYGRLDAVAAQPKVDKVVDALLAFRNATLKEKITKIQSQLNIRLVFLDTTLKEDNKDIKSIKHKADIRRRDPERK